LATYTYRQFRKALGAAGFELVRSAKHETWRKELADGTILQVRMSHKGNRDIPPGTFHSRACCASRGWMKTHSVGCYERRGRQQQPGDRGQRREFDFLYVGRDAVLLNETKSAAKPEYAKNFVEFVRTGWIVAPNAEEARLVTVYVKG